MHNLNNNEIISKIISISGAQPVGILTNGTQLYNWNGATWQGFNALIDDALCFKLMVEFGVWFTPVIPNDKLRDFKNGSYRISEYLANTTEDKSPNRAICLAIIELHEGKQ